MMALIGFLVIGVPEQARDAARAMAETKSSLAIGSFFVGAALFSWNVLWFSRLTLRIHCPKAFHPNAKSSYVVARNLPVVLSMGILLGVARFCWSSSLRERHVVLESGAGATLNGLAIIIILFIALPAIGLYMRPITKYRPTLNAPMHGIYGLEFTLSCVMIGLWLFLLVLFWLNPFSAVYIGTLGVAFLTMACWTAIASFFVLMRRRTRWPLFLTVLIFVFTFSYFNLGDNTAVNELPPQPRRVLSVQDAFQLWLKGRPDMNLYPDDKPYPVFIVAAEGGGVRASYLAALVLARLQDHEPRFAYHVFGISGVSGGSLGAAVYACLCRDYLHKRPSKGSSLNWDSQTGFLESQVNRVFEQDLLSPTIACGLFPNVLQRICPIAFDGGDRSKALEAALSGSYEVATGSSTMKHSLNFLVDKNHTAVPYLFLNTTSVETGERLVVSPLQSAEPIRFRTLDDLSSGTNLSVVTASVLSARFPLISSSGLIKVGGIRHRFVDGGYFENSGCATAEDLILELQQFDTNTFKHHKFVPIVIRIGFRPSVLAPGKKTPGFEEADPDPGAGGLEVISPINGIISARDGRGAEAIRALERMMDSNTTEERFIDFSFSDDKMPLGLGWMLSKSAIHSAEKQMQGTQDGNDLMEAAQAVVTRLKVPFDMLGVERKSDVPLQLHPAK